jgi:regulator of PEP synthase PpsR (kinase-PPPase family)
MNKQSAPNTHRTIFYISDRTGITIKTLGRSLISQFDNITFEQYTLPFIDTVEKTEDACRQIANVEKRDAQRPIIFMSIINPMLVTMLGNTGCFIIDIYHTFIGRLEQELHSPSAQVTGRVHSIWDNREYTSRMEAVNYALATDDGIKPQSYDSADIILIGVSRSGKTPTCLYLALEFCIRAANFPFTEEDLHYVTLPKILRPYKQKIYGLTIDPFRLHTIRSERRPNSPYSQLEQCKKEIQMLEAIYKTAHIPYLNSTSMSIEELATQLMVISGLSQDKNKS